MSFEKFNDYFKAKLINHGDELAFVGYSIRNHSKWEFEKSNYTFKALYGRLWVYKDGMFEKDMPLNYGFIFEKVLKPNYNLLVVELHNFQKEIEKCLIRKTNIASCFEKFPDIKENITKTIDIRIKNLKEERTRILKTINKLD